MWVCLCVSPLCISEFVYVCPCVTVSVGGLSGYVHMCVSFLPAGSVQMYEYVYTRVWPRLRDLNCSVHIRSVEPSPGSDLSESDTAGLILAVPKPDRRRGERRWRVRVP